jgi:hypothetical protein
MSLEILSDIPFRIDLSSVLIRLHIREDVSYHDDLQRLLAAARSIGKPLACYRVAYIDSKGDDFVIVDGVRLTSRILRVNLEEAQRLFIYVVTAGQELEEWVQSMGDLLKQYCADAISEMVLHSATQYVHECLIERYHPGQTSQMEPGSLADWPLTEQRPLFTLLDDVQQAIGVQLTDSCLMIPRKSVSVVEFPTEVSFVSCQLCLREQCPSRKAPYEPGLYDEKYRPTTGVASTAMSGHRFRTQQQGESPDPQVTGGKS